MEAFLRSFLPRILSDRVTFGVYPFQGKPDLLRKLPARLSAYAKFLPPAHRIVVVVDQDDDDCRELKQRLEKVASAAGLRTRRGGRFAQWRVVNRIAIEELEAWYFGDWDAVAECYPRVPKTIPKRAQYRDPDDIRGGTWEAFERVLQGAGYFEGGLSKTEAARLLGTVIAPERTTSRSFTIFCEALSEACL